MSAPFARATCVAALLATTLEAQPRPRGDAIVQPLPALPAFACDTAWGATPVLAVQAGTGLVHVRAEPGRTESCTAVRGAGARVRRAGDTLVVALPGGRGVAGATVVVRVPVGTPARLAVSGGVVVLEATRAPVALRAPAGRVALGDVREVTGEAGAARVEVARVAAGVTLRAATAPLVLDDVAGDVVVEGGAGPVVVRGARGAVLRVRTSSGAVRWQGAPDPAGRYDIVTATGPVDVALAPGVPVAGTVSALRAPVTLGAGVAESARGGEGGRTVVRWRTVPAPPAGGALVTIRSTTGPVRIVRGDRLPSAAPVR